jgi:hypothetical protein
MSPDRNVHETIEAIWRANRGEMARRIATLEQAVCALRSDELDDELRARAICDAHKLAGALGMFDLATGSELSRDSSSRCRPPEDRLQASSRASTSSCSRCAPRSRTARPPGRSPT